MTTRTRFLLAAHAGGLALLGLTTWSGCGDQVNEVIERPDPPPEGCTSDAACGAPTPRCDPERNLCVACLVDQDCAGTDDTPVCAVAAGQCVECVDDRHCEEEEERCSITLGVCALLCDDDVACEDSDGGRCDPSVGVCVECLTSADCEDGAVCEDLGCADPPEGESRD